MTIHFQRIMLFVIYVFTGFVACFALLSLVILILFRQFVPLIPSLPTLLGMHGTRTYLILFQNNMELRPGGGFIGSYATVSVNKGKIGPLLVQNTYDADGQLRIHVEPYYIGRRYIQVHLYMRDSNFDVDFARSAQKVAYLFEKETGHHADGVIAIDLSYVQSLVAMLSPIFVWQYNLSVTPNNFFWLTELHADRHSFSGSTQKQDFLHGLFESMQQKISSNKIVYSVEILERTFAAIRQKHVLFELADPKLQDILTKSNVSSTLYDPRPTLSTTVNDFFGLNEANIGVNKSNHYLKRSLVHHVAIAPSGKITEDIGITYTNTTPKEEWPTGRYIAYVRVILPHNALLTGITFDGQQQHLVPAVTDYRIYEKKGFKPPLGLEVDREEEEGKTIYGFIILVSYHTTKVVHISYQLGSIIPLTPMGSTYNLVVFKQPGMDNDPYSFVLTYPSTFHITANSGTVFSGSVQIQSTLLTDKSIVIQLRK